MLRIPRPFFVAIFVASLASQDSEPEPRPIEVKDGRVTVEKLSYPVFEGVKSVEASQFGGIRYDLTAANEKAALKMAAKIKAFYQGKKIGGAKLSKFKKFGSPQRSAWVASGKSGKKMRGTMVLVNDREIRVYVLPDFEDETLALML